MSRDLVDVLDKYVSQVELYDYDTENAHHNRNLFHKTAYSGSRGKHPQEKLISLDMPEIEPLDIKEINLEFSTIEKELEENILIGLNADSKLKFVYRKELSVNMNELCKVVLDDIKIQTKAVNVVSLGKKENSSEPTIQINIFGPVVMNTWRKEMTKMVAIYNKSSPYHNNHHYNSDEIYIQQCVSLFLGEIMTIMNSINECIVNEIIQVINYVIEYKYDENQDIYMLKMLCETDSNKEKMYQTAYRHVSDNMVNISQYICNCLSDMYYRRRIDSYLKKMQDEQSVACSTLFNLYPFAFKICETFKRNVIETIINIINNEFILVEPDLSVENSDIPEIISVPKRNLRSNKSTWK